ncbi:TetR/AcrR family transcriptional regulator [Georgenia wangjunii]|uniref:TetR/AcrR family transcriptional regulator n=1 Tax=Georgenia wangjunii TaxID=3117730 RepID=UPI002F26384A
MSSPSTSLRERRRSETWMSIHEAAASLALERGLENATVEAVAEAAGVSPRTFFNYFATKDDAVLGMRQPVLEPALVDELRLDHDVLDQVSRLLLAVYRSAFSGTDVARRQRLVRDNPRLGERRRELMAGAEDLVRQTLTDLLGAHPDWSAGLGQHAVEDVARMLVILAAVPLRSAIQSPDHDAAAGLTPENLASSLSLLHQLLGKLS